MSEPILGALLVGLMVVGSILSRKMDVPGALVGGGIALAIGWGGGLMALGLLATFFVLGVGASQWKKEHKRSLGLAQENEGKRSVSHALSNGGVAGVCGVWAGLTPEYTSLMLSMMAGSLAAATADTLASELGNIYGRKYVHALTFKPDIRGKDGVISWEGTLLGALGAGIMALVYGWVTSWTEAIWMIGLAGLFGNYVDSVLGATLQLRGYLSNHGVNVGCTVSGALVAGGLYVLVALNW